MIDSYEPVVFKFSGAGNDFVVLDGRQGGMEPFRDPAKIGELCKQYHTDGLMILTSAPTPAQSGEGSVRACHAERSPKGEVEASPYDFVMEFYNPDGSGGMMCGNGGRCIVAFADMLGIKPAAGAEYRFLAPDGIHVATIISSEVEKSLWTVRLKMIDVEGITPVKDGYFLNTGTRHFVKFVDDVNAVDVEEEGKRLRWDPVFQPEGTNVNFVQVAPDGLHVRTFEKGVEGETLACGTGLTASAIVYGWRFLDFARNDRVGARNDKDGDGVDVALQCRRGDWLRVEFTKNGTGAKDVFLTGPAECVSII